MSWTCRESRESPERVQRGRQQTARGVDELSLLCWASWGTIGREASILAAGWTRLVQCWGHGGAVVVFEECPGRRGREDVFDVSMFRCLFVAWRPRTKHGCDGACPAVMEASRENRVVGLQCHGTARAPPQSAERPASLQAACKFFPLNTVTGTS